MSYIFLPSSSTKIFNKFNSIGSNTLQYPWSVSLITNLTNLKKNFKIHKYKLLKKLKPFRIEFRVQIIRTIFRFFIFTPKRVLPPCTIDGARSRAIWFLKQHSLTSFNAVFLQLGVRLPLKQLRRAKARHRHSVLTKKSKKKKNKLNKIFKLIGYIRNFLKP